MDPAPSLWLDEPNCEAVVRGDVGSKPYCEAAGRRSASSDPYAPRRQLAADRTADVAIVGAGIAGLATAYALTRQGASVVVLDRDVVAGAASGRNAGFILQGVAENYVAACRRFGAEHATRASACGSVQDLDAKPAKVVVE